MASPVLMAATKYLTFELEDELYAMDISRVREVLDYTPVTKVPRTPRFMLGVINLRGKVVPVVDLRIKFGMVTRQTVNTCVIIVEVRGGDEGLILGLLADSVHEVLDLEPGHIEQAPRIGANLNTEFIEGIGKQKERFIIILNIEKVFSTGQWEPVRAGEEAGSVLNVPDSRQPQ